MSKFDREDEPRGICVDCGRAAVAELVDEGIGPYEFWGDRGVHHDWHRASPCCDAEVVDGEEHLVSKTIHVARKDHKYEIKRGDRYQKLVYLSWIRGGRRFYNVIKRLIPKA